MVNSTDDTLVEKINMKILYWNGIKSGKCCIENMVNYCF